MIETWRPVVGLEGLYEVSSVGRVRNLERMVQRRVGRGADPSKIYWSRCAAKVRTLHTTADGYQQVKLTGLGSVLVHTLILEAFVGPCPPGLQGCHDDGTPANNSLTNLCWGSPKKNAEDRIRHGRNARGERHGAAVLSPADVLAIRASNERRCDIARQFGVTPENVGRIRKRLTWKHL